MLDEIPVLELAVVGLLLLSHMELSTLWAVSFSVAEHELSDELIHC